MAESTTGGATPHLPVDLYIPGCPPHPLTILDGQTSETATLCGRDAVQVRPLGKQALDLADLGDRLAGVGPVQVTPF